MAKVNFMVMVGISRLLKISSGDLYKEMRRASDRTGGV